VLTSIASLLDMSKLHVEFPSALCTKRDGYLVLSEVVCICVEEHERIPDVWTFRRLRPYLAMDPDPGVPWYANWESLDGEHFYSHLDKGVHSDDPNHIIAWCLDDGDPIDDLLGFGWRSVFPEYPCTEPSANPKEVGIFESKDPVWCLSKGDQWGTPEIRQLRPYVRRDPETNEVTYRAWSDNQSIDLEHLPNDLTADGVRFWRPL